MKKLLAGFGFLLALGGVAQAHPGHGAIDIAAGFLHPLSGLDHMIAMVIVGLLAALMGGRIRWALPLGFVCCMVVGAAIGLAGASLPMVETAILVSLAGFAALTYFHRTVSASVALSLACVFGVFHGLAHGMELPADANGFAFISGFVTASVGLHILGFIAGTSWMKQRVARIAKRAR